MGYLNVRIRDEELARLDEIKNRINRQGLSIAAVSRSDLARLAILKLIEAYEKGRLEEWLKE